MTKEGAMTRRYADQVEVKKHRVSAVFPGSDQGIDIETVNGAITLD